jgi:hypothetical protein
MRARNAIRPVVALEGSHARDAERAVAGLVQELQAGWDQHDADVTDQSLAANVMWGSPFGTR